MSRHESPARDPNHQIIVGWDHPLLTYFVQVIDRSKREADCDDDHLVYWAGTSLREIYEIDDLVRHVSRYGDLSPELCAVLYADKDEGR